MSLNKLHDFIQVAYRMRKIYTNNYYFPKHILFTTIYLLQEHNLNPRNYSEQEIILIIFYKLLGIRCTCMQCLDAQLFIDFCN
jgi:hypothetical protein